MTQCRALTLTPGDRCTQVQDDPASISVTFHTSFDMPGCLIENCLPTARLAPSRPTREVTDSVQSGQCSTSLNTCHTNGAGASISMLSSVNMYQMVHRSPEHAIGGDWGGESGVRRVSAIPRTTRENT